jgi:hypothetical protein
MVPWISLFSFWVVEVAIKNRDWLVLGWCAAVGLNVEACAIQLGVGVSRSGAEKDKFEIVVEVKLLFAKLRGCGTGLQKPSGGWVVVQRQKNFNYKLRCREFIKRGDKESHSVQNTRRFENKLTVRYSSLCFCRGQEASPSFMARVLETTGVIPCAGTCTWCRAHAWSTGAARHAVGGSVQGVNAARPRVGPDLSIPIIIKRSLGRCSCARERTIRHAAAAEPTAG